MKNPICCSVYFSLLSFCLFSTVSDVRRDAASARLHPAGVSEVCGKLPLSFEVNRGQARDDVRFLSRGAGYDLFLKANEAELRMRGEDSFASVTAREVEAS